MHETHVELRTALPTRTIAAGVLLAAAAAFTFAAGFMAAVDYLGMEPVLVLIDRGGGGAEEHLEGGVLATIAAALAGVLGVGGARILARAHR